MNYDLVLDNGEIVEDWSQSPLYNAPMSEKKDILEFLGRKGVEIHKQELTRDEVAFINGYGGAPLIENLFLECMKEYPELWLWGNEFATTSRNGKRLSVNNKTFQVEEASDEKYGKDVRLLVAFFMFPGLCVFMNWRYSYSEEEEETLDFFDIRLPFRVCMLGSLFICAAIYFAMGMMNPGGVREYGLLTAVLGIAGIAIASIPCGGNCEIRIKGQEIQIVRLKKVRRTYSFDQIRLCEVGKRRIRVYMWDSEKKAFDIYKCMPGYDNFYQRVHLSNKC